jgi:hypothetical protein
MMSLAFSFHTVLPSCAEALVPNVTERSFSHHPNPQLRQFFPGIMRSGVRFHRIWQNLVVYHLQRPTHSEKLSLITTAVRKTQKACLFNLFFIYFKTFIR